MGAASSTPETSAGSSSTPSGATLGRRPENIRGLRLPSSARGPSGALVPTNTQGGRQLQEVLAAHLSASGGGGVGAHAVGSPIAEFETVGVVRNAVHLLADTLRLVPVSGDRGGGGGSAAAAAEGCTRADGGGGAPPPPPSSRYDIHFSFDATVAGSVTVLCHAREVVPPPPTEGGDGRGGNVAARYTGTSLSGGAPFRTRFTPGRGQMYRQKDLDVSSGDWVVRRDSSTRSGSTSRSDAVVWPLIICLAPSGTPDAAGAGGTGEKVAAGEVTYATLVPPAHPSGPWRVRAEKQRVLYEGGMYDMETIYGMQSPSVPSATGGGRGDDAARAAAGGTAGGGRATAAASSAEADTDVAGAAVDEVDAPGSECVVCLSDPREVFVLPCRHLCLCVDCAPDYKRQANRCPICRKTIMQMVRLRPQHAEATT